MIAFDSGAARFNYRVAGVCMHDGHVLLHRDEAFDFWALPGGRPRILESSRDGLVREMREEIAARAEVGRLLWVAENFFTFDGQAFHELGLYYEMHVPDRRDYLDVTATFTGREGDIPLTFRWFAIDDLTDAPLYPAFLRTALAALPPAPVHIIHTDD